MAITLGVLETYATVVEADAYMANSTDWGNASDELKFDALLDARYYMDTTFSCDLSSYDVIPDEMKYANAVLADDLVRNPGIFDHSPAVKLKMVKAGSVQSETEYMSGQKSTPATLKKVKGILKNICSGGGATVELIRA